MNKKNILLISLLMSITASLSFANQKKLIVCSSFYQYDWVLNILGNQSSSFNVVLLQNNGTDLHSYKPSVKDITKILTCDLFIYTGGESDEWVEDVLENKKNKNQIAVNLFNLLGDNLKQEEIIEGMQVVHHHDDDDFDDHECKHDEHDHDENNECNHDNEEIEYDEHIWLSIKNAIFFVNKLSSIIQSIDINNKDLYKSNSSIYISKLNKLNLEYETIIKNAKFNTLLFADRFPFRYLVDDYNLNYYAAFSGCSAESEASFETVIFLAKKINQLNLNYIFTIEKSSNKLAKTVISNSNKKDVQILQLDSLQSITQKEISLGKSYYSVMKNNLELIKTALM